MTLRTPALLLLVAALGGCSASGGEAPPAGAALPAAASTPSPVPAPPTTAPALSTTPAARPTRPATAGPSAVPTTVLTGLALLALPSGNIACALQDGTARCDIRDQAWTPPPRPASCPLDYGHGLEVGTSAQLVCAGDTVLGGGSGTLAYGTAVRSGDVVCTSSPQGVLCRNERSGHGFSLSRAAYRLF